ncbi:MAG: DUF1616 domain-containing protein [Promethearchaeota archaeon]
MLKKSLLTILILAIISVIGSLIYITAISKSGEAFTEFYLLGLEGIAENYPEQLVIDEIEKVTVGIINHEHEQKSYWIKVLIDGQESNEAGPILLEDGEQWEGNVTFTPKLPGENQKVEFLLFKGDEAATPAYSLHLWINVKDNVE